MSYKSNTRRFLAKFHNLLHIYNFLTSTTFSGDLDADLSDEELDDEREWDDLDLYDDFLDRDLLDNDLLDCDLDL